MAIAEQFAGMQMDQLIAAPLRAAMDAGIQLADSTADFISRVGFDHEGKVRTASFGYQRHSADVDGIGSLDYMRVSLPLLAVVPVPNLQVEEINILFDIEVKHSERKSSAVELGANLKGTANLGIARASITGAVSSHHTNTRSSDNSAKYHMDIRAVNHGTPEGLARVLDMMASSVTPVLESSVPRDENGRSLPAQAGIRAERIRDRGLEVSAVEKCLRAARDQLNISLTQLRRTAAAQWNVYRAVMTVLQDVASVETMEKVAHSWTTFQERAGELVKMLADSGLEMQGVSGLFGLKAVDEAGGEIPYGDGERYYGAIAEAQKNAVERQRSVDGLEESLLEAKAAYSSAVAEFQETDAKKGMGQRII